MRISATGQVGIGTSSPANPFQTTISSGAGGPYVGINQVGDNPYVESQRWSGGGVAYAGSRIKTTGDPAIVFEISDTANIGSQTFTERMRLTSGNSLKIAASNAGGRRIGISDGATDGTDYGTVQVTKPLDHDGSWAYSVIQSGLQVAGMGFTDNATDTFVVGNGGSPVLSSGGSRHVYLGSSLASYTAGSERMRIDSAGNVGIGRTSSLDPLTVGRGFSNTNTTIPYLNTIVGIVNTDRTANNLSAFYWSGLTSGGNVQGLGTITIQTTSYTDNAFSANMLFYTSNVGSVAERMRITSAGNLLINTTTAVSTLTVNGDIDANFFINSNTISANYTVPANFNAMTTGPITINTGITVTVSTGSVWVVI